MKSSIIHLATCLAFILSFCSCQEDAIEPEIEPSGEQTTPAPFQYELSLTKDDQAVAASRMAFAQRFMAQALQEKPEGNLILSPTSLEVALSMIAMGCSESALSELTAFLNMSGLSYENLGSYHKKMLEYYEALSKDDVKVQLANAIWQDKSLTLKQDFLEEIGVYYKSPVKVADFWEDPDGTLEAINQWCEQATDGLITDAIKSLPDDSVILLANALSFKSDWETPFPKDGIRDGVFHNEDDSSSTVPFMSHKKKVWDVAITSSFSAVRLPYKKDGLSMVLILPEKTSELNGILAKTDLATLSFSEERISLTLPKFDLNTTMDLTKLLQNSGVNKIFDFQARPFRRMSEADMLFVSQLSQAARLMVSDTGTQAAAVTNAVFELASSPQEIRLDRPFGFAIVDSDLNQIIFEGKIARL